MWLASILPVRRTFEYCNVNSTNHTAQADHGKKLHLDLLLLARPIAWQRYLVLVVLDSSSREIEIHMVPAVFILR
jgi:hypothetical protein